jgi:hypothetical protein
VELVGSPQAVKKNEKSMTRMACDFFMAIVVSKNSLKIKF